MIEWLINQITGIVVGLVTTGVWAGAVLFYYRRQRHSKQLLAWFALKTTGERMLRNVTAAIELLRSVSEGHPESKTERKAVSADLSDMELRLTRNLAAVPTQWLVEHLPFRDLRVSRDVNARFAAT
ncbi:MAG: hypothetical protein M3Y87_00930 [Myxococcota bacterium]|nr:hypothetical protein [Myxococcota bacterium]